MGVETKSYRYSFDGFSNKCWCLKIPLDYFSLTFFSIPKCFKEIRDVSSTETSDSILTYVPISGKYFNGTWQTQKDYIPRVQFSLYLGSEVGVYVALTKHPRFVETKQKFKIIQVMKDPNRSGLCGVLQRSDFGLSHVRECLLWLRHSKGRVNGLDFRRTHQSTEHQYGWVSRIVYFPLKHITDRGHGIRTRSGAYTRWGVL